MTPTNVNDFFSTLSTENVLKTSTSLRGDSTLMQTPMMFVKKTHSPPIAKQVIFNPPATIVYWEDGTKTVVKCDNDEFSEEFGFAMACVRKIYGTRNSFKAQFNDAFRPYLKQEKEKSTEVHTHQTETQTPTKKKANPTIRIIKAKDTNNIGLDRLLRSLACDDSISVEPCDRSGVFAVHL